jgi:AbrB family looped-hinge helix DNA binding protein
MTATLEHIVSTDQLTTASMKMASKGQVTIPKPIRDKYGLDGDSHLAIVDIDGMLLLSPVDVSDKIRRIDRNFDEMREELIASGATLEAMLARLRQIRESE